ncbi:MAG: hypothetical protein AAF410_02955 [Pseudomonadota bacterium]
MLEASLKEAQLKRQKRLLQIAITVIVILIVASAVLILGKNCCSFGEKESAELTDALSGEKPVISTADSKAETEQPDLLARESYLEQLNQYQTEIEPVLSQIDLATWQPDKAAELLISKDAALTAFTESKYGQAKEFIEQTITLGENLIEQAEQEFNQAMNAANQYFELDEFKQAEKQIKQALKLNSQSQEALAMAADIEKLGDIVLLLEQATVAKTENNLDKELQLIKKILEIAPGREQTRQRRVELTEAISQRQFTRYIKQAYIDIDNEDADAAIKQLAKARQIYPNRNEVSDVAQGIESLQSRLRFAEFSKQALAAMQQDDWQQAKLLLGKALNEKNFDKTLLDLLDQTDAILNLKTGMNNHIASPYRLAEETIKNNAKQLLNESSQYQAVSPSLKQQSEELRDIVSKMSQKVSVKVTSDNQTQVLVRGVGVVGKVDEKTIQLTPGEYKFEGKRTGYKSKLIEVLIPYDQAYYQIKVICDEPV